MNVYRVMCEANLAVADPPQQFLVVATTVERALELMAGVPAGALPIRSIDALWCSRVIVPQEFPQGEIWAVVSRGTTPGYIRFFRDKDEAHSYEWKDPQIPPRKFEP